MKEEVRGEGRERVNNADKERRITTKGFTTNRQITRKDSHSPTCGGGKQSVVGVKYLPR